MKPLIEMPAKETRPGERLVDRVSDSSGCTGRLALGTAQLGMPYGVANRRGRPSRGEAVAILDGALLGGIRCLDTAAGYGAAEELIGRHLRERSSKDPLALAPTAEVTVVTKLALGERDNPAGIRAALRMSRRRLGVKPGVALLHDPRLLAHWQGSVGDALRACRAEGEVGAIGVSVYTPEQFAIALEHPDIDVVQAPFSVLDRRLEQTGLLARAHARGVGVMLRSVLLQGLLAMEPSDYPAWLESSAALLRWRELCSRYGATPQATALRFVLERTTPATVVIGCESKGQLQELLRAANGPRLPGELVEELEEMASTDTRLIDPSTWPVPSSRPVGEGIDAT